MDRNLRNILEACLWTTAGGAAGACVDLLKGNGSFDSYLWQHALVGGIGSLFALLRRLPRVRAKKWVEIVAWPMLGAVLNSLNGVLDHGLHITVSDLQNALVGAAVVGLPLMRTMVSAQLPPAEEAFPIKVPVAEPVVSPVPESAR